MNNQKWTAVCQFDGFSTITARQTTGGWILSGSPDSSSKPIDLPTKRGPVRIFASLDTVHRFLADLGVSDFNVVQMPENTLFG